MPVKPITVMVVDDSALVRKVMTEILSSDPGIKVIAQASDPLFAMQKMQREMPQVITLDIEMPRMDGITFLKKIKSEYPLAVVICSGLTNENSATTMDVLRAGAAEIITKPQLGVKGFLHDAAIQIIDAVKAAAQAKTGTKTAKPLTRMAGQYAAESLPRMLPRAAKTVAAAAMRQSTQKVIAIGASTGGTQALRQVLAAMPAMAPGMVIVQHMPEKFTRSFAQHLNEVSRMDVREAQNGDKLLPGVALLAPGGKHMMLKRSGGGYHVAVMEGPLVNRHRPSVDVLFRSVARFAGANSVACLMTGMGDDGADGLKEIRQMRGRTFAQDEASSVVFGMPKEAWKRGGAEALVALDDIAQTLLNAVYKK